MEGMTQTTPRALAALQDAIRAELIAELVEKLTKNLAAVDAEDESYRDGFEDAIRTLEAL